MPMPIPTQQKVKDGYECEFVTKPPRELQTECPICLQILRKPHLVTCCCRKFCHPCIQRVKDAGKACPLCNDTTFVLIHEKDLERTLNGFEVRCVREKEGCKWTGELGRLTNHLNVEPGSENQLEGCEYVEIECAYNCGEHTQRHRMTKHQADECHKRPYSCNYCREYKSTFEDVAYKHYPVCKCYPLSCPNHCTPYAIERQSLEEHLNKDCPLAFINCDFNHAGCEVKLPRQDMPNHLQENMVSHVSLLAAQNLKLRKEQEESQRKIADMQNEAEQNKERNQQKIAELEASLHQNSVMAGKMKDQIKVSEEKTTTLEAELAVVKNKQADYDRTSLLVRRHLRIVPVDIIISAYSPVHTESFYTHDFGYKMNLHVEHSSGFYASNQCLVYLCLEEGEFDHNLHWPVKGTVTVQLLNQLEDKLHQTNNIAFNFKKSVLHGHQVAPTTSFMTTATVSYKLQPARAVSYKAHPAVSSCTQYRAMSANKKYTLVDGVHAIRQEIANPPLYLHNNCLHFRISKVETEAMAFLS